MVKSLCHRVGTEFRNKALKLGVSERVHKLPVWDKGSLSCRRGSTWMFFSAWYFRDHLKGRCVVVAERSNIPAQISLSVGKMFQNPNLSSKNV